MAGREDVIKFINEIGSGDADVFIGIKNTAYSDNRVDFLRDERRPGKNHRSRM